MSPFRSGRLARRLPLLALLATAVASVAVAGCTERSLPAEGGAVADGYPRDVRGADGQTLHVADRPRRVLPLNAAAFELARELIEAERFAALPATIAEFARDPGDGAWDALPRFAQLQGEELLAFEPDCVVAHAWQASAGLGTLRRLGVLVVEIPDITGFEVLLDAIGVLGAVFGAEDRAAALVADLERRRAALFDPARAAHRVMTYGNFGSGGWTAGRGTTADVAIGLCGLTNAAAEAGMQGNTTLSLERLLDLDPDVLIIALGGEDDVWTPTRKVLAETPELQLLRAVQEGRVVEIPTALYGSTSHTLMDFAEQLAAAVDALEL